MKRMIFSVLLLSLLGMSGCAHVISDEARRQVDRDVTFEKLTSNPDAFIGKSVLVGGIIAGVKNTKDGGQVEVVQLKLDDTGFPLDTVKSGGRFLAVSTEFIDSLLYSSFKKITLVGEVKGKKTLPLDEVSYSYPVIAIREAYVWKSAENEKSYPSPTPIPYGNYNPYYYGYDSPVWWYRPTGPTFRP